VRKTDVSSWFLDGRKASGFTRRCPVLKWLLEKMNRERFSSRSGTSSKRTLLARVKPAKGQSNRVRERIKEELDTVEAGLSE
jgi:hypothetical protein